MSRIIGSLVVFAILFASGSALTCYKCDSSDSTVCGWGIASIFMPTEDCSADSSIIGSVIPKQCVKITAKNKEGQWYVARGCAPYMGQACNLVAQTMKVFASLEGVQDITCDTCNEDKCNSSPKAHNFAFGLLIVALLSYFV